MNEAKYIVDKEQTDESDQFATLRTYAGALMHGERNYLSNSANLVSLLYHSLRDLNWCGVYFVDNQELTLGPFQGKPACTRIAIGKGVCGTAVSERRSIRVDDVFDFPGHIACDAESRSELVVPLIVQSAVVGVLDLDSPIPARFRDTDRLLLEELAQILVSGSDWNL